MRLTHLSATILPSAKLAVLSLRLDEAILPQVTAI
jgi:hypothetical protein